MKEYNTLYDEFGCEHGSPIDVVTYSKNGWIRTRCKNCKI